MNTNDFDYIVVGAGLAGASLANILAAHDKKVLIIEKRNHIAGNAYDVIDPNGILIHQYGPHIFHTNEKEVFEYLSSFVPFVKYEHKVLGNIDGKLVPIPFNFKSLEIMLPDKADLIKQKLLSKYEKDARVSIFDLIHDEDEVIKEFGQYVFEKVFAYYTAKQWGISIDKVDTSVINRVPVVLGYNDLYFSDIYQYMPKDGFTALVQKMLDNPNIEVRLDTNAAEHIKLAKGKIYYDNESYNGTLIHTGKIDELFGYPFGRLPYRSLNLVFEALDQTTYQPNSVVNYLTSEKFTRITEFKYLTGQVLDGKTTILKEFPLPADENYESYYPIPNELNLHRYEEYRSLASGFPKLHLLGRLAEYRYYNMDIVVKKAIELAKELLNK